MQMRVENILYICTANVFRSPVAAEMTKQLLTDKHIKVESAGMLEYDGSPLPQDVIGIAEKYGIDLSKHTPRQVGASLVDAADLILVFDNKQAAELSEKFPQAKNKTYTIKNYAGNFDREDMEDLWNKPPQIFERFIKELRVYVEKCVNRIKSQQKTRKRTR